MGLAVRLSISSALPWSAVTIAAPPVSRTASSTSPRQRSTVSTARVAAGMLAGVPDHVGVGEVDDPEPEGRALRSRRAPVPGELRRPPRARSSPACGRRSATSRGEGTRQRSSPGYGCSSPPLKKYVTCAYFSVSATCSWRSPRVGQHRRDRRLGARLLERDRVVPVLLVARHRRELHARGRRARSNSSKSGSPSARTIWRIRSGRKLNVSTLSPSRIGAGSPIDRRLDELVGLVAPVRHLDRVLRAVRRAAPRRARSRRRRASCDPSAGRGPCPSSGPSRCRCAPARRPPRPRPATPPPARGTPGDEVGSVSRPSVNACSTIAGTRSRAASSMQARRWLEARVHAAGRHQPDQVQAAARVARRRARAAQRLVLEEAAVRDRLVDAGEVLLHDRAGAEVQVADLGVAHLALAAGRRRGPQASSCVCG